MNAHTTERTREHKLQTRALEAKWVAIENRLDQGDNVDAVLEDVHALVVTDPAAGGGYLMIGAGFTWIDTARRVLERVGPYLPAFMAAKRAG